jgi:hypothetical protein
MTPGGFAMLIVPSYIQRSGVVGAPVTYKWAGTDAYNRDNVDLLFRFEDISIRGVLALAAGISEWIAWRLEGLAPIQSTLQFVEAVWAGDIAPQYTIAWDWECEPPFEGSTQRPLFHTCELLLHVFNHSDRAGAGSASQWAVYLAYLARHVLPTPKRFETWLQAALDRLEMLYPRGEEDPLGEPVPRGALEVDQQFDPAKAPAFLDAFLRSLDPNANRFLRKPTDMVALGFGGRPYRYP